jgi:hypothetical protein
MALVMTGSISLSAFGCDRRLPAPPPTSVQQQEQSLFVGGWDSVLIPPASRLDAIATSGLSYHIVLDRTVPAEQPRTEPQLHGICKIDEHPTLTAEAVRIVLDGEKSAPMTIPPLRVNGRHAEGVRTELIGVKYHWSLSLNELDLNVMHVQIKSVDLDKLLYDFTVYRRGVPLQAVDPTVPAERVSESLIVLPPK